MPRITNLPKYKASWQKWWHGLQPKWHQLEDGTFLQEVPNAGEEWEGLWQGGPNGFFMVISSLSWWVKAANGKADDIGLHDTMDDITHTSVKNSCTSGSPDMYKWLYKWYHLMGGRWNVYVGPADRPNVIFLD